jgi:N-acetylglucosaminyldiphosphoundecaprenol N-acetyl-beta-D-mannosaminyltransferase
MTSPASAARPYTVLGMRVDATSYRDAAARIMDWAAARESRMVAVANVHTTMEGVDSSAFRRVINEADLVTPDGMPLVWTLRALGSVGQARVYGPDLVLQVCSLAEERGMPVAFVGGTPRVLERMVANLAMRFPRLQIAMAYSPPFRAMTAEEDARLVTGINRSGAGILFVGLGCPKQERWMAGHKGRVRCVMLGVGAAFDFHAGTLRQAPALLQRLGLEWAFRLMMEPRRLWKRYARHNPRFAYFVMRQLLGRQRVG